jgi:hypothetical protein
MLLIALWIKHYTVSADKSIKYIARPCTLSLVDIRDTGYCVVIPDGGGKFRIRATRCASRK